MNTDTGPARTPGATRTIAYAAALLDAVARHSEQAVDFAVPIRCGTAADQLHSIVGFTPRHLPVVGDDAVAITDAITAAINALSSLSAGDLTDPVLDALAEARAAARAVQQR